MRLFDKKNNRLVYFKSKATNDYWDSHWGDFKMEQIETRSPEHNFCVKLTNKYLPKKSTILEGGCGKGQNVYALYSSGYNCIGVDFAEKTVEKINQLIPELDVHQGDVFDLKIKDNELDGYWSLGVIEHFYDGYDKIADEMARTIKKDGYLFLTVPAMSTLRKLKAKFGLYKSFNHNQDLTDFYQFALDPDSVIKHYNKKGFMLQEKFFFDAVKGIKDEVLVFKPILQKIYDNKIPKSRFFKRIIEKLFAKHCGHCVCLVLQNKKQD